MGVITVFVSDGECADSQLVRKLFLKYAIPFQTINVDTYPRKRALMIKLANCLKTPQVFFNKKHIGGATAVTSLFEKYDQEAQISSSPTIFERISKEVLMHYMSPVDSHMFKLTDVERYAATNRSHQDEFDRNTLFEFDFVQVTEELKNSIGKVSRDLLKWLPRKNNRMPILFKSSYDSSQSYKNYFSGSEAIKTFMKHYNFLSSDHAVAYGQKLLNLGIINRIGKISLDPDLFSKKGYYRLQSLQSPKILNSFRIWTREIDLDQMSLDPILLISRLLRHMTEIITSATNDAGTVDYPAARKNPRFRDFEEAVCQLQLANIKDIIDDENTKKAFFINTYNLMAKHAFVKLCPKKVKKGMFDKVQYNVGGLVFSMEDIYHGILRKNSKHPKSDTKTFSESDPRTSFCMQDIDARIHFALNDSNHTILYEYHKDAIDEELRVVAELYCESNERLYISGKENKVILPKFMRTFISDFTTNGDTYSLFESVRNYLRMDKFRLRQLNEILERESANNERVIVLFKSHLSPPRSKMLRSMTKIMSRFIFFKYSTSSITISYSTDPEDEGSINSPLPPLQQVDASLSVSRWTSDLTWECADCPINMRKIKAERPLQKESSEFSFSRYIPDDYSVNTKSTSDLALRKTKPERSLQKEASEFTLSSYIPDDYSVNTKSTCDLVPSSNTVIEESFETSVLSMRENVEGFETLYNNMSIGSTRALKCPNKDLGYHQVHIHITKPEHRLQKAPSESTFDYSVGTASTNVSLKSTNREIEKDSIWI